MEHFKKVKCLQYKRKRYFTMFKMPRLSVMPYFNLLCVSFSLLICVSVNIRAGCSGTLGMWKVWSCEPEVTPLRFLKGVRRYKLILKSKLTDRLMYTQWKQKAELTTKILKIISQCTHLRWLKAIAVTTWAKLCVIFVQLCNTCNVLSTIFASLRQLKVLKNYKILL